MDFIVEATSGKKGTGKDYRTLQSYLSNPVGSVIVAFADWVKTHRYALGDEDAFSAEKSAATRANLIATGTEQRQKFGDAYYVLQMLGFIELQRSRGMRRVLIPDLRFEVEFLYLTTTAAQGKFTLLLYRMEAPERNRLRIERESGGDVNLGRQLAEDRSETELDIISKQSGLFQIVWNDPLSQTTVQVG